jgi:uncharacterized SAM-binding protein YcdF (DUF218 family)
MYNLASKIITPLFTPLTLSILLATGALLLWKRRRLAFRLLAASVVLLLVCTSGVLEGMLVGSLENQYPDCGLEVPPAQAIVVLGGSMHGPSGMHHLTGLTDHSDRLLVAFRLYRSGKAPLVLCSGGDNPIGGQAGTAPEALWMARLLEEWNIPPTAIQIEGASVNTRENAIRSYQALAPRGIRRIILVTSAMHMPRAAGAFRKAGFEVIAAPADFHSGWLESNTLSRWLPNAYDLDNSDMAFREWLGIAVYHLRGWI